MRFVFYCVILVVMLVVVGVTLRRFTGFPWLQGRTMLVSESDLRFKSVILDRLKSINELHTAISSVQTIVTDTEQRKILGMEIGQTKMAYVAVGMVRAGLNLTELRNEDIDLESSSICVKLPPARILDAKIDVDRSEVYDIRQSTMFPPQKVTLQSNVEKKALEQIIDSAKKAGILKTAEEQAKSVITSLVNMMGITNVKVECGSGTETKELAVQMAGP